MTSSFLERIDLCFSGTHPEFHGRLLPLLGPLGTPEQCGLVFSVSREGYLPRVRIAFAGSDTTPVAQFHLSDGATLSATIENTTGEEKRNLHPYSHLAVDSVIRRLAEAGWTITGLDHIGFNLPWFESGVHPRIADLRRRLAAACLYHVYPTGEPWDFILPGDTEEIESRRPVDYSAVRRPKFELVSFDGASTPLVQIDLGVTAPYEEFSRLFPEAMNDPDFRNIWVYLETPYSIDVCLVMNGPFHGDWSDRFSGHRLPASGDGNPR